MDKDEQLLYEYVGRKSPFKVPQGYFSGVQDKIIAQIQSTDNTVKGDSKNRPFSVLRRHYKLYSAVACGVLAIAVSATVLFSHHSTDTYSPAVQDVTAKASLSHEQNDAVDQALDACADFAMMDNEDFYAYVSEN